MKDTPRMRAAQKAAMQNMTADVWIVGCQIEHELNAANERIKRMEEAGDALYIRVSCGCGMAGPCKCCRDAEYKWDEAKEAKP